MVHLVTQYTDFTKAFFTSRYTRKCNLIYTCKESGTNFLELYTCSTALCANISYWMSPTSDNKCGQYWQKFTDVPKPSMAFTGPVNS